MLYTGDRNVRDEACEQLVNVFPELAGSPRIQHHQDRLKYGINPHNRKIR